MDDTDDKTILEFVMMNPGAEQSEISKRTRINQKRTNAALERLYDAGKVSTRNGCWRRVDPVNAARRKAKARG